MFQLASAKISKTKNSNADTNELQNKIDKLTYKLYNIRDKEISSIEKNS